MLASVSPATRNRVIANPQSVFHHGQPRLRKCHSFAILTGDDSGKSRYNGFQFSHDSSESDRAAEAFRPWCITPLFGHLTATRPNLELSPVRTWNVIHHARKSVITPVGVYLSLETARYLCEVLKKYSAKSSQYRTITAKRSHPFTTKMAGEIHRFTSSAAGAIARQ